MSPLPWFRLYGEIVDDEKIRLLAFEDRWHYVAILCCKSRGLLDKREDDDLRRRKLALKLGLSARELDEVARRLSDVGLVDRDTLQPLAWDERQMRSDSSKDRVARFRERMKRPCNVTVTAQDTDTEEDKDKSKIKNTARVPRLVGRFEDFWAVYPCKKGRKAAEDKWRKKKLDEQADAIIADVRMRMQNDSQWRRGYIPYGSTYINGEGWRDGLPPQITEGPSKAFTAIQQALGVNLEAHDASRLVLDCLPAGLGADVRHDHPRPALVGHFPSDDCDLD